MGLAQGPHPHWQSHPTPHPLPNRTDSVHSWCSKPATETPSLQRCIHSREGLHLEQRLLQKRVGSGVSLIKNTRVLSSRTVKDSSWSSAFCRAGTLRASVLICFRVGLTIASYSQVAPCATGSG